MSMLRRCVRAVLAVVDRWYFKRYRLQVIGPVLFLGRAVYHGPEIRFADGTVLRERDVIGRLHFNNANIAALGEGSLHRVGLRFAKLMRESLRQLAQAAEQDPMLRDIQVFQGVTWIPSHGEVVGFVSTPMPPSWKTRLLVGHFRLLSWVFAPSARIRARASREPRLYWLTRTALASNLAKLKTESTRAHECPREFEAGGLRDASTVS
jgi:hypothetical protein